MSDLSYSSHLPKPRALPYSARTHPNPRDLAPALQSAIPTVRPRQGRYRWPQGHRGPSYPQSRKLPWSLTRPDVNLATWRPTPSSPASTRPGLQRPPAPDAQSGESRARPLHGSQHAGSGAVEGGSTAQPGPLRRRLHADPLSPCSEPRVGSTCPWPVGLPPRARHQSCHALSPPPKSNAASARSWRARSGLSATSQASSGAEEHHSSLRPAGDDCAAHGYGLRLRPAGTRGDLRRRLGCAQSRPSIALPPRGLRAAYGRGSTSP